MGKKRLTISTTHVSTYLSLHHLLGALEYDILQGTFDIREWVPIFMDYAYLLKDNVIERRVPLAEAGKLNAAGEVISVCTLIDDIVTGRRAAPRLSPSFAF